MRGIFLGGLDVHHQLHPFFGMEHTLGISWPAILVASGLFLHNLMALGTSQE
jgi:hypothetical protein